MYQKHGSKAEKGGTEANIEGEAEGEENIEEEMEENGDGEGEENIEMEIVENIDVDLWERWKKILDEKFVNILVQQLEKYVNSDLLSRCNL